MEVFISWWDIGRWVVGGIVVLLFIYWPRPKKKS